jgi:hypothetical protein
MPNIFPVVYQVSVSIISGWWGLEKRGLEKQTASISPARDAARELVVRHSEPKRQWFRVRPRRGTVVVIEKITSRDSETIAEWRQIEGKDWIGPKFDDVGGG